MRRGLVHALAWSLATGAAVTLSWWGVHSVLSGTVYDPPRALPLPVGTTADAGLSGSGPLTSSTRDADSPDDSGTVSSAPDPDPSADPAETGRTPGATSSASSATASTAPESPAATSGAAPTSGSPAPVTTSAALTPATTTTPEPSPDGGVKTYTVDGGRVTFDLGESSAELVSATPASGWQMQVWKDPSWIRVTFTRDGRELSVYCLWHDGPPRVQIEERQV